MAAQGDVVVLGAGASKCAGYPLGSEVLQAVELEVASTPLANMRDAWEVWAEFRATASGLLAQFLESSNPEVALSEIDLIDALLETWDHEIQQKGLRKAAENLSAGFKIMEDHFQGKIRTELQDTRRARANLLVALDWYFGLRHAGLRDAGPTARDYLRDLLAGWGLKVGDTVITTNWDAVAELTLGEEGLWNPFDGYGFQRNLVNGFSLANGRPNPLPKSLPRTSAIKVLKLHGSFGWREEHGRVWLDYDHFLQFLPFKHGSELITFREAERGPIGAPDPSLLLYPSFLKRLKTPQLYEVWELAGEAIRTAKRVLVVGYSLPAADVAVRTLMLPLRRRSKRGEVNVEIVDRSEATLQTWMEYLDGNGRESLRDLCHDPFAGI